MDPRCGHFLAKMYAKMKELGPVGGRAPACVFTMVEKFALKIKFDVEIIK